MRSKFKWIFTLLLAFTMQFSFAQEKTITGVVSDSNGPIPGANVVVKGTTKGVSTGFDGKYSIKAKEGDQLVFSFMGMADVVKTVGGSTVVNTTLQDGSKQLADVVVTAMGIKKRKNEITNSQQVVSNKELTQASNPNVISSLAGKVSGLQISTTSNGVDPSTRIVLRGSRTLTGNNQALVVIDNAISSASVLTQLPPDIIESVNVLKGAQGGALYGAQGSNGVIIVTTKKGAKSTKLTVNLNASVDFENISFVPEKQTKYGQGWIYDPSFSADGHVPWENGAWGPSFDDPNYAGVLTETGLPQADGNFLLLPWKGIKDNYKEFFQTGLILQNGISLNVGGDDSYAMMSINRQVTDFMVQDDGLKRNSFIFKGGKKFNKFRIDGNVNYISQSTSTTDSGLYEDLLQVASNIPVEMFNNAQVQHGWSVYIDNPYWTVKNKRFDGKSDFFNGTLALNYDLNDHINVSYNGNVQVRTSENQSYTNEFADYFYPALGASYIDLGGHSVGSNYYNSQTRTRNFYGDLIFNFDYNLAKDLNLKANIGNNMQDSYAKIISQGGKNLDIPYWYHINNVLNPDLPSSLDNRELYSRDVAFFANLDFNYKDYLFLNLTGRVERRSTIPKWFSYPSVGLSFIPTKAFEMNNEVLNFAKLSANYTLVGNSSAVAPYALDQIGVFPTGFPFGSISSYISNQRPTNLNIKPEQTSTYEVTANLGLFNDRVSIDASAYHTKTKDLITFATTSSASSLSAYQDNTGELHTNGFEIDLGLVPIKTDSFKWNLKASYTTFKTVVDKITSDATQLNLLSNTNVGIFAEAGEEFPLIKGTTYQRDPNGNIIVSATTGEPLRNTEFTKLGKATPDYILGLTNSFEYKGLKLTVVADFRTGHSVYSEVKSTLGFAGHLTESAEFDRYSGYVIPNSVVETAPGVYTQNANSVGYNNVNNGGALGLYPGVVDYYGGTYARTGENFVIDATALKIRELSLSYSLPEKMLKNTGITAFKFGINARNPFVFLADGRLFNPKNGKANQGFTDPEASITTGNAQGFANVGQYPTSRTFGCSINVTF